MSFSGVGDEPSQLDVGHTAFSKLSLSWREQFIKAFGARDSLKQYAVLNELAGISLRAHSQGFRLFAQSGKFGFTQSGNFNFCGLSVQIKTSFSTFYRQISRLPNSNVSDHLNSANDVALRGNVETFTVLKLL